MMGRSYRLPESTPDLCVRRPARFFTTQPKVVLHSAIFTVNIDRIHTRNGGHYSGWGQSIADSNLGDSGNSGNRRRQRSSSQECQSGIVQSRLVGLPTAARVQPLSDSAPCRVRLDLQPSGAPRREPVQRHICACDNAARTRSKFPIACSYRSFPPGAYRVGTRLTFSPQGTTLCRDGQVNESLNLGPDIRVHIAGHRSNSIPDVWERLSE